jgi:nicotinamidase-related amidase
MDVQNATMARLGEDAQTFLSTLGQTAAAARRAGVHVIFVRIGFRKGAPEMSPNNAYFSVTKTDVFNESNVATQFPDLLVPQPDDIVVTKRRVSAFAGSDLDVVLRSLGIGSLVLTGVATSGVVLSTLRQAADLDFVLTVLSDLCADRDPEVHRFLMQKVFPSQASVMTAAQWTEAQARNR